MAKTPIEKELEKTRIEMKRQAEKDRKEAQKQARQQNEKARKEALRQQAASIVEAQQRIDGFCILDSNAETVLTILIEHCNNRETGHVNYNRDDFPVPFQNALSLELEKLTQYGMLTVYTWWMNGGIVNLLPTAFEYFEKKEEVLTRQPSKEQHVENNYYGNTNIINGNANAPVLTGDNNTVVSRVISSSFEEVSNNPIDNDSGSNGIFISHRSTDKAIADMLFDFFVATGIPREAVFCSSLPGNDVKEKISEEVRQNIQNSIVNIAILSKDYYDSAYCLNEAGIMWFLNGILVIPIAMPEIKPENMYGFLNSEYKVRRLDNYDDIAYIYECLIDKLNLAQIKPSVMLAESQKLIKSFNDYISKREIKAEDTEIMQKRQTELDVSILAYSVKPPDSNGKNKIEFSVILNNVSTKEYSVFDKYLHFFREDKEIYSIEVTRFETQRREDAIDSLLVLVPVNRIITLPAGHAEQVGVVNEGNELDDVDKVTFTCKANRQEYEFIIYEKDR